MSRFPKQFSLKSTLVLTFFLSITLSICVTTFSMRVGFEDFFRFRSRSAKPAAPSQKWDGKIASPENPVSE